MTIQWGKSSGADINLSFSGNCALDGCRIVGSGADDDIALDWAWPATDVHTMLPLDGTLENWGTGADWVVTNGVEWVQPGWMGPQAARTPNFGGWKQMARADDYCTPLTGITRELWLRREEDVTSGRRFRFNKGFTWDPLFYYSTYGWASEAFFPNGAFRVEHIEWLIDIDLQWHHFCLEWDAEADRATLYVDGMVAGTLDNTGLEPASHRTEIWTDSAGGAYHFDALVIAERPLHGGEFTPHRYEAGSVTLQYQPDDLMRLTSIDWSGTFGPSYGYVTKVEVYSRASWHVVASDSNGVQPPITGLNYVIGGPNVVRFTLAPKQDTLQSETPLLDWVLVNLEPLTRPAPQSLNFSAPRSNISVTTEKCEIRIKTSRRELGVK